MLMRNYQNHGHKYSLIHKKEVKNRGVSGYKAGLLILKSKFR